MKEQDNGRREEPRVVLPPQELQELRNRWTAWQTQQILLTMVQEAYGAYVRTLRTRYDLPPQYNVDFQSGEVTVEEGGARDG